jgi:hypothetical protein
MSSSAETHETKMLTERALADEAQGHDAKVPYRRHSVVRATKSPGVARIEAISSVMTETDRIFIVFGVFLVAYGMK